MAEISLLPEKEEGKVDLSPSTTRLKDPDVLKARVQKADYALGKHSPGQAELEAAFWSDMEDRVREQAALAEAIDTREAKQQAVEDLTRRAAAEGRSLTPEDREVIMSLTDFEDANPATVMEERWARRAVAEVMKTQDEYVLNPPEEVEPIADATYSMLTKQQIAQRVFEEVQQKYDDTSWGSFLVDFGASLIPGVTWENLTNRVEGGEGESFLTGSNVAEQIRGLYFLSDQEFEQKLKETVDSIASENILDAVHFAQAAIGYSSSDEAWDNIFFGLDVVDIATIGTAGLAVKGAKNVARRGKSLAKVAADSTATSADIQVVSGQIQEAAKTKVLEKLEKLGVAQAPDSQGPTRTARVISDLISDGPGILDPEVYARNASSLSNEAARRLMETLTEQTDLLVRAAVDGSHIVRIDDEAAQVAFRRAEEEMLRINHRLEDGVVEMRNVRESDQVFGGVDYVEALIGRKDATGFETPEAALNYGKNIYRLPEGGYDVVHRDGNYFIRVEKTVDETALEVQPFRVTTDNQAPETWVNTWLGFLRSPDDTLSRKHSAARKVATYGGNQVMAKMNEVARNIGTLSKNETKRLGQIIDEARFLKREAIDPATGKKVKVTGKFYKDVGELEQAYLRTHGSMPSEKEIAGYFGFRQLMDFDYLVKNISVYRDKARLGVNQKSVGLVFEQEGKKIYKQTPFFEGRTVDNLPDRSGTPFTVAWIDNKGRSRFGLSSKMFKSDWDDLDDLISKGYKIIQVGDTHSKVFDGFVKAGGESVQYIVTRDVKEKALSPTQVPWNEGGHWIYPEGGLYLKQAKTHRTKFGRRVYDGDVTAHHFVTDSHAAPFAKAYETARVMLKNNDPNLDAYVQAHLPYTGKQFARLFSENGPFDIDTPFVLTRSGERVADNRRLEEMFSDEIVDPSRSEHELYATVNRQYTQERGERLTSIKNTGTEANPVFKLHPTQIMDPMQALSRSSSQIAKTRYFDDYKHREIENWATQFADTLDADARQVRADPMRFLKNPVWRTAGNKAKLAAAQNSRRAILNLLGQDTQDMRAWKYTRQKVADGIFKLRGSDSKLLEPYLWGPKTDAAQIARSSVFHAKLGLMNIVQFPLQAQAIIHVAAVDGSPIRAAQANFAFWSMRMRLMAPDNQNAQTMFGKTAAKALGLDRQTMDEMYTAFRQSGMDQIEGEYALLDDYLNPSLLFGKKGAAKALDWGAVMFKEGNRVHRGVSFATSFLKWRAENPLKKLTATEMEKIVGRADLYYINMSRASNNPYQQELAPSVVTQFWTYQTRLMEQMLGTRLTPAEKLRVMAVYSAAYGIPIGVLGTSLGGIWNSHESIRQAALENGVDTKSPGVQMLLEGGVSTLLTLATGEEFNVSERYGPAGLPWLSDLFDGKFFEVLGGAAGSFMHSAYSQLYPFAVSTYNVFAEDAEGAAPLTSADLLDVLREISSVNNAARAYFAYHAGEYLTRNEQEVLNMGEVDGGTALLMGALGLTPQDVADTYLKMDSLKDDRAAKKEITDIAMKQYKRGLKYAAEGDSKSAEIFFRKAQAAMAGSGMNALERAEVFNRAIRDNRPLFDKIDEDFTIADPEKRLEDYQRRNSGDTDG